MMAEQEKLDKLAAKEDDEKVNKDQEAPVSQPIEKMETTTVNWEVNIA